MKVLIIGGFLGSGKTSVLLQLAKYITRDNDDSRVRMAIIENEIGDIAVDDQVLSGGGYDIRTLFSGCVCCTLTGELIGSCKKIKEELDPEYLVIEPSGVADFGNIAELIEKYAHVDARCTCIVDAQRWDLIERAMGQIIPTQVGAANVILLNKVDTVEEAHADEIVGKLRGHNDSAPIYKICANDTIDEAILEEICG